MAKAKAVEPQQEKSSAKAPVVPVSATAAAESPADAVDAEQLWERFCTEAGFSAEVLELEGDALREEIASLEARIAEKRTELEEVTHREETARTKLAALVEFGFSPEAALSAMKVEFRPKRAAGRAKGKEVEVGQDEKAAVLDALDREGQPLPEIARILGRDPKDVQRALLALVAEGKAATQGERRGKIYMRV